MNIKNKIIDQTNKNNEIGNIHCHPNNINWSNLYRGSVARTHIKQNIIKLTLKENQIQPGIIFKIAKLNKGNHPPQNKTTSKLHIKIILEYSAKKKKANVIDEYLY